jgi:glycerol dehydrogenase-like iron-containing ADH family enzyme
MYSKLLKAFREFDILVRSRFTGFGTLVQSRLQEFENQEIVQKEITGLLNEVTLSSLVAEIEKQKQFRNLVLETQATFIGDYHKSKNEKNWHDASHCNAPHLVKLLVLSL